MLPKYNNNKLLLQIQPFKDLYKNRNNLTILLQKLNVYLEINSHLISILKTKYLLVLNFFHSSKILRTYPDKN